jgi:hypothetical protein
MDHLNRGLKLLKTLPERPQRARREFELPSRWGPP